MKVFVAGAMGAVGRPLTAQLVAAGHEVVGTTRSPAKADAIRAAGAQPVVLDAFDRDAVRSAIAAAQPEVVVHQLTDLPASPDPKAMAASATNRLRRETVPLFLEAAREAGARRVVVQSISFITEPAGPDVHDEDAPLWLGCPDDAFRDNIEAVREMEAAVVDAGGLVLRYGWFYGPGTWYERDGAFGRMLAARKLPVIGRGGGLGSFVHVDDAAAATVLACGDGPAGIFNVTDRDPAPWRAWTAEAATHLGAKPPRRVPAFLARLAAGPIAVHYATTLRAQSSERFRAAYGWEPRPRAAGFAEAFGRR